MNRRLPHRVEHLPHLPTRNRPEGNRRIGLPERNGPHLGDVLPQVVGQHSHPDDVAHLPLVRPKPESRVSVQKRHRVIPLIGCQYHVARTHVLLQIDELLVLMNGVLAGRHQPDGLGRLFRHVVGCRKRGLHNAVPETRVPSRPRTRMLVLPQYTMPGERAATGSCTALLLHRFTRHEPSQILVESSPPPRL